MNKQQLLTINTDLATNTVGTPKIMSLKVWPKNQNQEGKLYFKHQ